MPKLAKAPRKEYKTQKQENPMQIAWDAFLNLRENVDSALKEHHLRQVVTFFATLLPGNELGFEMNRPPIIDKKKNAKNISTEKKLEEGEVRLLSVHWHISAEKKPRQKILVTRSETSQQLGEVNNMGLGPRKSPTYINAEAEMVVSVHQLAENFQSAAELFLPEHVKKTLHRIQLLPQSASVNVTEPS